MRVAIAGAGNVGRSIAAELLENGHEVLLIDKDPRAIKAESVPRAEWLLADACELASLEEAALQRCEVVIAAPATTRSTWSSRCWPRPSSASRGSSPGSTTRATSGCSTRPGVSTSSVSTPRMMSALVEEAVTVGDLVRLFTFRQGEANLVELTLPEDSPMSAAGRRHRLAAGHRAGGHPARGPRPAAGPGRHARAQRRTAVRRRATRPRSSSRTCSPRTTATGRVGPAYFLLPRSRWVTWSRASSHFSGGSEPRSTAYASQSASA